MADGRVVINSEIDDDGISRGITKIKAKLKGLNTALLTTAALGAAITLGSALIPAAAVATGAVMGLAASLAAAGIAAGAFGVVAVSALTELFDKSTEVAELEKKVAEASSTKERIAAQKELNAALAGMTEHQKETIKQLNEFKSFWSDFVNIFEPTTFAIFNLGLEALQKILIGLGPTIGATAQVVEELMTQFNKKIDSGGFQGFFDWLETNGAESLRNFMTISGNVLSGFFSLLQAFSPLGASMEEGLVKLTEKFKNWATTLSENPAFQNFITYVKENGPVLMEVIGNIVQVGKDLVTALAPLGAEVLQALQWLTEKLTEISPYFDDVVDKALDFVAAIQDNWPAVRETVIGLATAVGSFVAISKGLQIYGMINALFVAYRTGTLAATLATYGFNTALLLNPITWIVALIAALIAIGVLLYRNWDTVKAKAGELWSWLKEKWNGIASATSEAFGKVKEAIMKPIKAAVDFIKEQVEKIKGFFSGMKISLPNIKLPHFSLSGKFSLAPPSVPKLNVDWYAQGGLFNANTPQLVGMGDNTRYQEAALPLSPSVLGMIGQKIADTMPAGEGNGSGGVYEFHLSIPLDGRDLVKRTIRFTAEELERMRVRKGD
ncbi:hypothetical protein ABC255_09690 [Neobacillus sp. 3P2-tot-E-2]|uniref:phage tail protein n=1 Tax=Neobacillus sp. 3P2-tot-E-2 TaxID=3132212 RepID=UPI0039A2F212